MKISNLLVFSLLLAPVFGGCGGATPSEPTPDPGTEDAGTPDAGEPPIPDGGTPTNGACNADTCANGCCIAGSCYRTQSNYACGSLGGTCAMCQVIQGCQKEDAFRGWECLTDQSTQWKLQPVSATIPPKKPNGDAWDGDNSAPEVLVVLDCPVNGTVTSVRTEESSSFTPRFTKGACTTRVPDFLRAPVTLRILDVDAFSDDEIITAGHTFTEADFRRGTLQIPITQDGTYSLTLQLTRVE